MNGAPVGYAHLIERHALAAKPLLIHARVSSGTKGRGLRAHGDHLELAVEPSYHPGESLVDHLQFALRYEGINLEVLALLFERTGAPQIEAWLAQQPESVYARRAAFLYEWLTGTRLAAAVPRKARYVPVLDTGMQFGPADGPRDKRLRVVNNLPGARAFCPLVRRTAYLAEMVAKDLRARAQQTLARYDPDLLRRAASFLYLKETQSSFEVEREKPSAGRAQRFADLLRQAEVGRPLAEARLVELQHAIVDPRFHEFTWRRTQNWIGKDLGYRRRIDFVPPRPDDLPALMAGLLELAEMSRQWTGSTPRDTPYVDAVVLATVIAFGFVFLHPFMDGNGRIHRYLIHEVLATAGFTPRGIVLPVSAVILAHLDEYIAALEAFSRPLMARTLYNPDTPEVPAAGNDALYFRYFDATEQAEFLYRALERTIEEDLQQEIEFLLGFDRAQHALNALLDWPDHSLELFIRLVHQNGGTLSKTKRASHFAWMTDAETEVAERAVVDAFGLPGAEGATAS